MDLARAPCRAPLTARKMGSGDENGRLGDWHDIYFLPECTPTSLSVPAVRTFIRTDRYIHRGIISILVCYQFIPPKEGIFCPTLARVP
jgi:hypothetical protein